MKTIRIFSVKFSCIENLVKNKLSISRVLNQVNGMAKSYYENGALRSSVPFKHGLLEGQAKLFFPNGSIKKIENYKDGKKIGIAPKSRGNN